MVILTEREAAQKQRFETAYARSTARVMRSIERRVCGCDFGGNSWTTKSQADHLIGLFELKADSELLDLGAGTGWPGLYLSIKSDCRVTLVDLPEVGLQVASDRAIAEGIAARVKTCVADASGLPFDDASFDAINYSDLLCCLVPKRAVLEECLRVTRPSGRMVFSVISLRPGLEEADHQRALANAPEFVEADDDYRSLLELCGWRAIEVSDLTWEYEESCARQVRADKANYSGLVELLGQREARERLVRWKSKLSAIEDGLFLREQFTCLPCS